MASDEKKKPVNPSLFDGTQVTLRDLFAAFALAGMIGGSQGLEISVKEFASQTYKLADAMLAEREKGGN